MLVIVRDDEGSVQGVFHSAEANPLAYVHVAVEWAKKEYPTTWNYGDVVDYLVERCGFVRQQWIEWA